MTTVPVGTANKVRAAIQEELDKRKSTLTFDVISNPEFLKEGSAIADCMKPDRVVIGVDSDRAEAAMRELYKPYFMNNDNLIFMDIPSADERRGELSQATVDRYEYILDRYMFP